MRTAHPTKRLISLNLLTLTMTPFVIGISDVSYLRYSLLSIIEAGIWAMSIGAGGYYFGQAVEAVLGDIKHYELELMAAIVDIAMLIWFTHFYQRKINKTA